MMIRRRKTLQNVSLYIKEVKYTLFIASIMADDKIFTKRDDVFVKLTSDLLNAIALYLL